MKRSPLVIDRSGYKVGMDEVKGLRLVLASIGKPLKDLVRDRCYWDDRVSFEPAEYKSRDGFIPYRSNCGGLELFTIIPSCERWPWEKFLSFSDCDECNGETQCGYQGRECASEGEGHLDAKFRIWLKFEGLNDAGEMEFYFYCGGGNGDAPYFRVKAEATVFEESFSCKSLVELKRKGDAVVKRMLKKIGGAK